MFPDGSIETISSKSILGPCHAKGYKHSFQKRNYLLAALATQQKPILTLATLIDHIHQKAVEKDGVAMHWFRSLDYQQFQVLLTLFSKSFSPFPHGTCSLSVSHIYLALDGIYHPFKAAFPSNPTLWKHTVRNGSQAQNGSITLFAAVFQQTLTWAITGNTSVDHNSQHTSTEIFGLSLSRFTRRYYGNPS